VTSEKNIDDENQFFKKEAEKVPAAVNHYRRIVLAFE